MLNQPRNSGFPDPKLNKELVAPGFRRGFMSETVRSGIAHQVRAMRDKRGWNQKELGDRAGKPQSVISRLEDPDYGKVNIQTLIELAEAFDVALLVKFVGFGELLAQTGDLSPEGLNAPSYVDDPYLNARGWKAEDTQRAITETTKTTKAHRGATLIIPTEDLIPRGDQSPSAFSQVLLSTGQSQRMTLGSSQ
jgi:transcriptional regulator with XRE-family HTH domain